MRPGPGTCTVPLRAPQVEPRVRLVVASHAGSGPHALGPVVRHLPPWIEVLGVVLPGREHRLDEPVHSLAADPGAVLDAVLGELDARPALRTVAFGHSLGAALAGSLTVARPGGFAHAVLSAPPGPGTASRRAGRWTQEDVQAVLRRGGGTPDALLRSPAWREHQLARLRPELTLAARLTHLYADRWCDVPVTLLAGDRDDIAPPERVGRLSGRIPPRIRVLPGGHFSLLEPRNVREVAAEIVAACDAPAADPPGTGGGSRVDDRVGGAGR